MTFDGPVAVGGPRHAPIAVELGAVRERSCVPPKSPEVLGTGSVGPWEPGGNSSFQVRAGRDLAWRGGFAYDSYGASTA